MAMAEALPPLALDRPRRTGAGRTDRSRKGKSTLHNDHKDIEAVLQTYFDGVYEDDPKEIAAVSHECFHMFSVADGKLNDVSRDEWIERAWPCPRRPETCLGTTGSSRSTSPGRRARSPR